MQDKDIHEVVSYLRNEYKKYITPAVTQWANTKKDPFHVLISCILSLRTKDETTRQASNRLFNVADSAEQIIKLETTDIEKLIYPVGFYRNKAKTIKTICNDIITLFKGKVPDNIDDLLTLKGVGRKTANLVVTLGFNKPGICVDIHVHRISNRLGYIKTENAEQSEFALREKLPHEYWLEYNDLLVSYGQNVCTPVSPWCGKCGITHICMKNGVDKTR